MQKHDTRIAFLAYCSVAPKGYYAAARKPGVAPMRAITHYEPLEDDQPGTPCDIFTYAHAADLACLVEDIRRTRNSADVLVLSMHWGIHHIHGAVADYQKAVARAAIDAGADIILGHHPHILKGIELHRGKAVFYSMGNFAFDIDVSSRALDVEWNERRKNVYRSHYRVTDAAAHPDDPYHAVSRFSMIVKASIEAKRIQRISFVPILINARDQPTPQSPQSSAGKAILAYLKEASRDAELGEIGYSIQGDEFVIRAEEQ